ncbi:PH domain-containing protein [uncultured Gemmiger sp.]|uniref:PH domain-containing protein n=1 Tax=uncultured Gemmiger sp. TaxID=1623490 RepID=UPI0025F585EA|nr:PH domain-containing protein [uncultured Gemmiger sp.]
MKQRTQQPDNETIWKDRKHFLWFPWSFEVYRIANGRIYTRTGLLNQEENECMIYRVLDISLKRTLLNRICGTGTIIMRTKDASDGILTLKNIKDSQYVKDTISEMVEAERQEKGLLGREMFGAGGGHLDGIYRDAIDEE